LAGGTTRPSRHCERTEGGPAERCSAPYTDEAEEPEPKPDVLEPGEAERFARTFTIAWVPRAVRERAEARARVDAEGRVLR
jgi:hypothetical protein